MIGTEEARKYIEEEREKRKQAEQTRLASHVALINDLRALKGRILGEVAEHSRREPVLSLREAYANKEKVKPQGVRDEAIAFLEVIAGNLPNLEPAKGVKTRRQAHQMASHAEIKEAFTRLLGAVFIVYIIIKEEYEKGLNAYLNVPVLNFLKTNPKGNLLSSGSTLFKLIDTSIFSISQVKEIFEDEGQKSKTLKALDAYLTASEDLFGVADDSTDSATNAAQDNIFFDSVKATLRSFLESETLNP